jgi:hypothetical protein
MVSAGIPAIPGRTALDSIASIYHIDARRATGLTAAGEEGGRPWLQGPRAARGANCGEDLAQRLLQALMSVAGHQLHTLQSTPHQAAQEVEATGNTGSSAPQDAFDWWMNSTILRNNLLNTTYTEFAIGYIYREDSNYRGYFVAVFALPD